MPSRAIARVWTVLGAAALTAAACLPVAADNVFWLDFTDFDASPYGFGGQEDLLVADIYSSVVADYSPWSSFTIGYDFDAVTPGYQAPSGTYSHIDIGGYDGDPGRYIFGMADDIDWRNLNHEDGAVIYSSEFDAWDSSYFDDWDRLTNALAGTTAHEMGHILGLCHHHAFGPIGEAGVPSYGAYPYEGGSETNEHLMATGSTGLSKSERAADRYFGERETWVLDAADGRITVHAEASDHGSRDTAQLLSGGCSVSVTASISVVGEEDWYAFSWHEGDRVSIEVFSQRCNRFSSNPIDPYFELYDPLGNLLDSYDNYWSYSTGHDGALLDYLVPQTGMWHVAVGGIGYESAPNQDFVYGQGPADDGTGSYELWTYRDSVPEPATTSLLLVALASVGIWGRRQVKRMRGASS